MTFDAVLTLAVLGGGAWALYYLTKAVIDHYFDRKRDLINDLVRKQRNTDG